MKITLAKSQTELSAAYRLRYAVYVEEMRRSQRYADHSTKQIVDQLDCFGHTLIAKDDDIVVGTLRINFMRDGDLGEYVEMYGLNDLSDHQIQATSITTRLMIAKRYRSGTLAVKLAKAVYQYALLNEIEHDFIDCNAPLDRFFERMGHKRLHQLIHPEYGDVTVMKLDLRDSHHLREIRSPFLSCLEKPVPITT